MFIIEEKSVAIVGFAALLNYENSFLKTTGFATVFTNCSHIKVSPSKAFTYQVSLFLYPSLQTLYVRVNDANRTGLMNRDA